MNWGITGHKQQLDFLATAIERGKLAHAYIFAGPTGVGKKAIARRLSELLLEQNDQSGFNADYIEIKGEGSIKIEQIRELIYKLSLKPYAAKYKIAVIENADEMTIEAANALLKVMEEPKSYTVIILITSNASKLPRTILSRGQRITFGPIPGAEEQVFEAVGENMKYYDVFTKSSMVEKLIAVQEIADLETVEIQSLLQAWLIKLETELRQNPTKNLANKISQIALSLKYLDQNANNKLLLSNLMLNA